MATRDRHHPLHPLRLLLAALVLAACDGGSDPAAPVPSSAAATGESQIKSRYIVTLREGVTPESVAAAHGLPAGRVFRSALNGFTADLPAAAVENMGRDGRVRRVEPDAPVRIVGDQSDAPWGLDRIDQRSGALDGVYRYGFTGAGVTVYVVDTGIRFSHDDFGGRARAGYSYFGADGSDCHGHGTHVAGTIAGATFGVAKAAEVVSVQVLTCYGSGSLEGVISGLDWIAANAVQPAVVNMSLGGGASATLDEAVANVVAVGIPVMVAAGNANTDACGVSPAREASAVTVAAADANDRRASWSNWGDCVDVFAPGVGIESASYQSDGGSASMSGTSMAAPHAAGVAALVLEELPGTTPTALESLLQQRATRDVVDAAASANDHLLYSGSDGNAEGGSAPTADFSFSCTGLTCGFTDDSTDPDGDLARWDWAFGDGTVSSARDPAHNYAISGSYTVELVVTDSEGRTSRTEAPVAVSMAEDNDPPQASFDHQCDGLECAFTDTSGDPDGVIASRAWDFGDGTTSSVASMTHGYAQAGDYTVTLVVEDDDGATGTSTLQVSVQASNTPPRADFGFTCDGLSCDFQDQSVDDDGTITSWGWDFGDGMNAAGASVPHTFSGPGTYVVSLTVSDDAGASDTASDQVTVTVSAAIVLEAAVEKVKGKHLLDLTWSGAAGGEVEIRATAELKGSAPQTTTVTTPNDGQYVLQTENRGGGTYRFTVCEIDGAVCSDEVTVVVN